MAQDLFVEFGYESVTVDQIAMAAGMSRRSFFRYFASKDELVIGKYDLFGDKLAEAFEARPTGEPVWESLRRVFDLFLAYTEDPTLSTRNAAMESIVFSSPKLHAAYLEKVQRMQRLLAACVRDRLSLDESDARAEAIVGAAFSCLLAAQSSWQSTVSAPPGTIGELLDEMMMTFDVRNLGQPSRNS